MHRPFLVLLAFGFTAWFTSDAVSANPKIETLCDHDPALAKLQGNLLLVRDSVKNRKAAASTAFEKNLPHAIRGGKLQCIVGAREISEDLIAACHAAGLEVVGTYDLPEVHHLVVHCTDPSQLEPLVHREDVLGITPEPLSSTNAGPVDNQADFTMNAITVRSTLAFDGNGVRVGVLSDSVREVLGGTLSGGTLTGTAQQSAGELPPQIRVVDPGPGGGTDEGAGMMELIYDLAPGCDLSFASASTGYSAFAANIAGLANDPGFECDVLVDDVTYFAEPVYQDGPIALAAEAAFGAGVAYFSSAGNRGDNAHERDYVDFNSGSDDAVVNVSGNDVHDFGLAVGAASTRHLEVVVAPQGSITVVLRWDEPGAGLLAAGPGAESDLDLYLTTDTSFPLQDTDPTPGMTNPPFDNVLVKSTSVQGTLGSPLGEPVELITYTNPSFVAVEFVNVVVDHFAGREPVTLHLMVTGDGLVNLDKSLASDRTLVGHPAAANAMAVAAMFYGEVDLGGSLDLPLGQLDVEPFSALGGNVPIFFPPSGTPRLGSPDIRFKPEITAPDGTNTSFFGSDIGFDLDAFPNFFGTSASAPHAAAVAALMLHADPDLTPAQLYGLMRASVLDVEVPGPDFLSGDGLLDALQAVLATDPPVPAAHEHWELYR